MTTFVISFVGVVEVVAVVDGVAVDVVDVVAAGADVVVAAHPTSVANAVQTIAILIVDPPILPW